MKIITAFLFFLSSATSLQLPPKPTVVTAEKLPGQGFSPRPTTAPSLEDLRKRQAISQIPDLILATDATCGFQDGNSNLPVDWLCGKGRCAFATTAGQAGAMYCCGAAATATCEKRWTACVDSASISAICTGNNCDSIQTALCDASNPYCGRGVFVGLDVSIYFCASTTYTGDATYYTSYIGHAAIPFTAAATSTSSLSSTATSTSSTSTSPIFSPTPPPPPPKKPIGPIVGGAIGGVAVLAGLVVAVIFILRSRKRNQNSAGQINPDQAGGAQGYNPYSPQPEKVAAVQQSTYMSSTSPAYSSQPTSPMQQYSPQPQVSPVPYQQQQFTTMETGMPVPQELNSNPISPRPVSEMSFNPAPTYVPYQPPAPIHEL